MDPHLPFLKAIAANPPDDLPRLVYADFLEETGDEAMSAWAEFIRHHVSAGEPMPGVGVASRRLVELVNRHLSGWRDHLLAAVRKSERSGFGVVRWRRGFPETVEMTEAVLIGSAPVFDVWPVCGLRLAGEYSFSGFATLSFLRKLVWLEMRSLNLPSPTATGVAHDWVKLTTLAHIRIISFAFDDQLTDAWLVRFVSALSSASFVPTLEELDLSRCFQLTDAGANTLATARSLERLKTLRLTGVPLSPPAVAMLRRRFGDGLIV